MKMLFFLHFSFKLYNHVLTQSSIGGYLIET